MFAQSVYDVATAIFAMSIINQRDKRKKASKTFFETIVEQAKEANKYE